MQEKRALHPCQVNPGAPGAVGRCWEQGAEGSGHTQVSSPAASWPPLVGASSFLPPHLSMLLKVSVAFWHPHLFSLGEKEAEPCLKSGGRDPTDVLAASQMSAVPVPSSMRRKEHPDAGRKVMGEFMKGNEAHGACRECSAFLGWKRGFVTSRTLCGRAGAWLRLAGSAHPAAWSLARCSAHGRAKHEPQLCQIPHVQRDQIPVSVPRFLSARGRV